MESWSCGRITGTAPKRLKPDDRIRVYFNWSEVGCYKSYADAQKKINTLLREAPVNLDDVVHYLHLEK